MNLAAALHSVEPMTITEQTELEHEDDDATAVEEFAGKLVETITGGLLTCLIEIGFRTRLFELATAGPGHICGACRARWPPGAVRPRVAGRDGDRGHL